MKKPCAVCIYRLSIWFKSPPCPPTMENTRTDGISEPCKSMLPRPVHKFTNRALISHEKNICIPVAHDFKSFRPELEVALGNDTEYMT